MRLSIFISALLLAFGVWGGVSSSQDLQFSDPTPSPAAGDAVHGAHVHELYLATQKTR